MNITRISFLSFLFSFLFSPFTLAQHDFDGTDHAHSWANQCAEQMTPQELQLVANFLYVLYANALIDSEIQRYHAHLLELSQAVRNNLSDPYNANDELMYLRALTNKIACSTKIRFLHTQMLDAYVDYYSQNQSNAVDAALKELQLYASDSLYTWAEQQQEETNNLLEKSTRILLESAQNCYIVANTHRGLRDGILPFAVEERDKALSIFNLIIRSTPICIAALDKTINAMSGTADHAMRIIAFGARTYGEHYQALYEIITAHDRNKAYATIMFAPDGLLAPEYKTVLPHSDYVFEYMLELTQLFEQINS